MHYLPLITSIATPIVTGLIVGILLRVFDKKADKRDKELQRRDAEAKHHTELRKQEDLLSLELIMATAKLSYANAVAIKRGHPNGEIEEGIEAFEKAKKEYYKFINKEYVSYMEES